MKINFEELIDKYLDDNLAEDEKQIFARMLNAPENQLFLASKIDKQFFDESLNEVGDEGIGKLIFTQIQQKAHESTFETIQLNPNQQPTKISSISWYRQRWVAVAAGVAAVLILFFGLGKVLFTNEKTDEQVVAVKEKKVQGDSNLNLLHYEINTTLKERLVQLPDGSSVILASHSEISYLQHFIKERNINLKGKAFFKVAKDKTKPFTVISGDISTTALGTQFTVTAFEKESQIKVRLFEGKVVIKILKAAKNTKVPIYLMPGEQFVYNSDGTSQVTKFKQNDVSGNDVSNDGVSSDQPILPENTRGSWYMFNNQSLGGVLDQLAGIYNVKIIYNKKDVQKISFTGKYDKTDSLDKILNELAVLHHLKIAREDSTYIITK